MNKPVFFGVINHNKENNQAFIKVNFKTVPYVTVSTQKTKRFENEEFYKEEDRWLVGKDQIYDASKILEFMNKRLNTDIKL